jgi:hypothetical protein
MRVASEELKSWVERAYVAAAAAAALLLVGMTGRCDLQHANCTSAAGHTLRTWVCCQAELAGLLFFNERRV